MKSALRLEAHTVLEGENVCEVWWGDTFLATVTGADIPGIRINSKYPVTIVEQGLLRTDIAIGKISVSSESKDEATTVIRKDIST